MSQLLLKTLFKEFALKWSLWLLVWSSMGLSFGYQSYVHASKGGASTGLFKHLMWGLEDWYVWGAFSIPIIVLARRFPIDPADWRKSLPIHVFASLVAVPIYQVVRSAVCGLEHLTLRQPLPYLLVYWMILAVWHAWHWHKKYYEREVKAADMERRMVEAQLMALQMQLNPHFLFNTLNAISNLMHRDLETADRMIVRLGDLLRDALDSSSDHQTTLEKEITFLERYIDLERMRFGSRLSCEMIVPDELKQARVPALILQPLVENAIRHGIEPHAKSGELRLSAERHDQRLVLRVEDNGGGLGESDRKGTGIGLANTRARLQGMYGDAYRMELNQRSEGGTEVIVEIPFHTRDQSPVGVLKEVA